MEGIQQSYNQCHKIRSTWSTNGRHSYQTGIESLSERKDSGPGIPSQISGTIFDLYNKCNPCTDGEESFGMGLVICRWIVEAHGGKIWYENNFDKGANFYVELPSTDK
ncbi:ATP-binding protein [Sphingobacterium sp. CZ-2]|nr:ATP-binding protein [Sphingobacterium sp. CZ-2]